MTANADLSLLIQMDRHLYFLNHPTRGSSARKSCQEAIIIAGEAHPGVFIMRWINAIMMSCVTNFTPLLGLVNRSFLFRFVFQSPLLPSLHKFLHGSKNPRRGKSFSQLANKLGSLILASFQR